MDLHLAAKKNKKNFLFILIVEWGMSGKYGDQWEWPVGAMMKKIDKSLQPGLAKVFEIKEAANGSQ